MSMSKKPEKIFKYPRPGDDGKLFHVIFWSPADHISFFFTALAISWSIGSLIGWSINGNIAYYAAAIIWAIIGLSDMVDGKVARKIGGSLRGATMDELSDKFKTGAGVLTLAIIMPGRVHWVFPALFIARDIFVTIVRRQAARQGIKAIKSAKMSGKVKTTLVFTGIVMAYLSFIPTFVITVIFLLAIMFSIISAVDVVARWLAAKNLRAFIGYDKNIYDSALVSLTTQPTLARLGIPNWLTAFRLSCGPIVGSIIVFRLFGNWSFLIALIIAGISAATDLCDGAFASREDQLGRNYRTAFGKTFDPIADKTLQYLIALSITVPFLNTWLGSARFLWLWSLAAIICIARELVLLGWRIKITKYMEVSPPHLTSKIRSALLVIGLILVVLYVLVESYLLVFSLWNIIICTAIILAFTGAALFSVISAIIECRQARRDFANRPIYAERSN